jgi:hypothetical protein
MSAVGMHRAAFVTFAAFLALAAPSTAEAKRVALVVGINIHDNLAPGQQLQKARNDARAVAVYCGPVLRHLAGPIQAANFRSAIAF